MNAAETFGNRGPGTLLPCLKPPLARRRARSGRIHISVHSDSQAPIALQLHRNGSEVVAASAFTTPSGVREAGFSRILVLVDFSEGSRTAIRHAGALAAQHGAIVRVVCIVAPVVALEAMAALGWAESEEIAAGKCEARLREMACQELGNSIKVESEVALGEPGREIVRLAREWDADLIVMFTHGYTGFKRVLLGSTAERVRRTAPCPVQTVRADEKDFAGPESQALANGRDLRDAALTVSR